jgi:hypothetical protein
VPNKKQKISDTKKLSREYDLIFVAHHEAAHAIVGLLRFFKVSFVSTGVENERIFGVTDFELVDEEDVESKIIQDYIIKSAIYMSYAGLVAEKILYRELCGSDNFPMVLREGSSPDITEAAALISKFNLAAPGAPRQAYKRKIIKELTSLLKEYWEDIRLVSHFLYKKKKITEEELRTLLIKKSKNKTFWKNRFKKIDFLLGQEDLPDDEDEIIDIFMEEDYKR